MLVVFSRRDPENRVRGEILRILVVGELRGMSFKPFYANLRKNRLRQVFSAPTIYAVLGVSHHTVRAHSKIHPAFFRGP